MPENKKRFWHDAIKTQNMKSKICIEIELDEKKYPDKMRWVSLSGEETGNYTDIKAFFLSLFDKKTKDTFQLDLWTKDMQVIEMDRFIFQTISSLADMYYRATKNAELANEMQGFARFFGKKTKIIAD